ncbi:MAG: putative 4-hydroxybenzoate polyprenyltransferase [Acidobacteria bacterium]|nr:putative 4-hydroxybenzoate polyprenyltransferase [Acidobacteriota bacterium]MDW7985221.1 4-hydroxybenzoate octaprenyltransferase [Acidobacteriota bacterium]
MAERLNSRTPKRPSMKARLQVYVRFVKFEHTVFSLPNAYAGAWLASPEIRWKDWALILLALLGARTVAMALNRWLDRDLDAQNPRTRDRELPAGRITPREVWGLIVGGLALFGVAAWALSPWCLYLSPVPALVFWVYPQMKRWTVLAHWGVGTALALTPLGGFLAIVKTPEAVIAHPHWVDVCLLAIFVFLWVAGFDIIYALLDIDFDRAAGLNSVPALWGSRIGLVVAAFLHGIGLACLAGIAVRHGARTPAGVGGWFLLGGMFLVEHILAWRGKIETAFFHVNACVGFVVLAWVAGMIGP